MSFMRMMNADQVCEYLEGATGVESVDYGHAVVHAGISGAGAKFLMMYNWNGEAVVTESL